MCRAEKVCWSIAALGAILVLGPILFEDLFEPLGDFRFAGMLIGIWIAISAPIISRLFKARGRAKARLLRGEGLLAHWTYSPQEWSHFTEEDAGRASGGKWILWGVVAFWAVLFGAAFPLFDPEDGWAVTWVMAGLLALLAGVIVIGTWLRRSLRRKVRGEARISLDSLWLDGGELHVWKGWGSKLEGVGVVDGSPPCLAVEYSTLTRTGRQTHNVRVPIPRDKDDEAAEVAARLLATLGARQ